MLAKLLDNRTLISSLVLILSSFSIYYLFRRRSRKYERVAKISKLSIYPVKSLNGVEVDHLIIKEVCHYGKYRDRQFILIDEQNNIVTSQQETSLVKIKLSLHNENEIWFDAQNLDTLKITVKENVDNCDNIIDIKVFDQPIKGMDCGEKAKVWFSKYLSKSNMRLIQHVSQMDLRPARTRGYLSLSIEKQFPIVYQNRASIYLMNESSLNDLNSRLEPENRVTYRNFRPNIIVTDCPQYAEDNWLFININDSHFRFMNHCGRCVKITINLETGKFGAQQPLKTLRKYRMASDKLKSQFGQSPLFGIYLGPENEGTVNVNDLVFAVKK